MRNPIANDNAGLYYDGVETEFWVYPFLIGQGTTIQSFSIGLNYNTGNGIMNGGTTLPPALLQLLGDIRKGWRFVTDDGTSCILVGQDGTIGQTFGGFPLLAVTSPLNISPNFAAKQTTVIPMIPVYSIAESGPKTSADMKEIRNHGAAETALSKKFKTTVDMSGSGYVTKGDKGLSILRKAALGGGMVYLRWVSPDDQAYEGYFEVSSGDMSAKTDEEYMNQFEFKAASPTKVLDLTLR